MLKNIFENKVGPHRITDIVILAYSALKMIFPHFGVYIKILKSMF